MIMDTTGKNELLTPIEETVSELQGWMASLDENKINTIPFKDSWTAGQLFRHVTKSINGMSKAMISRSRPADRDPGEKYPNSKKSFSTLHTN